MMFPAARKELDESLAEELGRQIELKPIGNYPMGTQPNWIEMVDLK
jgi:hypothetical protein